VVASFSRPLDIATKPKIHRNYCILRDDREWERDRQQRERERESTERKRKRERESGRDSNPVKSHQMVPKNLHHPKKTTFTT